MKVLTHGEPTLRKKTSVGRIIETRWTRKPVRPTRRQSPTQNRRKKVARVRGTKGGLRTKTSETKGRQHHLADRHLDSEGKAKKSELLR